MDLICMLWRAEPRGTLSYKVPQWITLLRCTETEFVTAIEEFTIFTICDTVTNGNGIVTVSSRRMSRDEKARQSTRLRVSRHRRNTTGNGLVRDSNRYISEVRSHKSESESESESEVKDKDKDKDNTSPEPQSLAQAERRMAISADTWKFYSAAYQARYKITPVRNQKVNSELKKLVALLGQEEAPQVAAFYLTCTQPLYLNARHPTNLLVRDATGLRTQWKTNTRASKSEVKTAEAQTSLNSQLERILNPVRQQTIDITPTQGELTNERKTATES